MGRSRGGLTTKVHALVDAAGLPLELTITPGQAGDCPEAAKLLSPAGARNHHARRQGI